MEKIYGKIRSGKGFYLGDVCYVLAESVYYGIWKDAGYRRGVYEVPGSCVSFAVADTAYGDGYCEDNHGFGYAVDAGVIGLVPAELVVGDEDCGHFFEGAGEAEFTAEDGWFSVTLPDGEEVYIDTRE